MEKKPDKTLKWKNAIKGLLKFCFYLLIFCVSVFIFLLVASDLWLKSYEIDTSEMLSAPLKEFPLK